MNKVKRVEVPSHLFLTTVLSTSLTITLSLVYMVLSILGIVYRFNCDVGSADSYAGSNHFMNLLYRVYILEDECANALNWENLTGADSVFLLNIITLCASTLTLVAAIVLIAMATSEEQAPQMYLAAYVYVGVSVASLVVDLTFATHFGMDYGYLTDQLNESSPGLGMNYDRDMVRLAAFLLMTISLKGFVAHIINLGLLVLLVVYVVEYKQSLNRDEHSIHKLGALNAYDQPRRRQDSWQQDSSLFLGLQRGPQINPAFVDDSLTSNRSHVRDPVFSVSDYQRSESWQPAPLSNSRPFSYLEEPKRGGRAPPSPVEPARRRDPRDPRDWQPPVPAPDYSPQNQRRLKSALKPSYM